MVSNPLTDPEWADRSVDFIDRAVATVRKYTTQPVVATARGVVFGLLASFGVVSMLVLLCIALTRGLIAAFDAAVSHSAAVWISYFIVSAMFAALGIILMRKRFNNDDNQ
jgi:hypothetical protein